MTTQSLDWTTQLLAVTLFLGLLVCGTILLWALCYFTGANPDDDRISNEERRLQAERDEPRQFRTIGLQTIVPSLRAENAPGQVERPTSGPIRQLNDVLLATAMSSIPLNQFQEDERIVVNVQQEMCFNRNELGSDEHECIVCKTHRGIAWKQVSCYAQTSIGVLVYKRQYGQSEPTVISGEHSGKHQVANHANSQLSNSTLIPITADANNSSLKLQESVLVFDKKAKKYLKIQSPE